MLALVQTLAVAEHLNFRHASKALGVSQSSVSARVKALEQELGILLFERHARGVRVTDAGRNFIEHVTTGIDQLNYAVSTAGMAAAGKYGRLRIGVHDLTPRSFLAKLLGIYRKDHACIEIDIVESTARSAIKQLRSNELDIAFVAGCPNFPDFHSRPIWSEQILIALSDRHRLADQSSVTWTDLAGETFLVRHRGTGPQVYDHIALRLAGHWLESSILRFDVEHGTLMSLVEQSFGITVVGAATSLLPTSGITFLPLVDELEPIHFSAVWSPFNDSTALRNLLILAKDLNRLIQINKDL